MIRVAACISSILLAGSLALPAAAQQPQKRPGAAPAAAPAARPAAPAPRAAPAAPRAAAPAPRISAPRAAPPAPRIAAPQRAPQAGPRIQRQAPPAAARVAPRAAPRNAQAPQINRNAARDAARSAREAARSARDAARSNRTTTGSAAPSARDAARASRDAARSTRESARDAARSNRETARDAARAARQAERDARRNNRDAVGNAADKAAGRAAEKQQLSPRERRQQAQTQRQIERLEQRAKRGKLNARAQQRLDRLQARQKEFNQRQQAAQPDAQNRQARQNDRSLRRNGQPRVTEQAARQGRFAAPFQNANNQNRQARRAARIAARQAWRQNRRAAFVAWAGPVFWPYAYSDIFDYTFWPYAYDDAYWAYAYDDMFYSVYWAYPAPYADEFYVGPYAGMGGYASAVPSGGKPSARSRTVQRTAEQLCKDPGKGITAWPIEKIRDAVRPTAEQRALLDDVKAAASKAAEDFKASCVDDLPMTPPGRLEAMLNRLEATLGAVRTVRPPLEAFYASLSDEQQARFNAIGPDIGQEEARVARNETQGRGSNEANACGGDKAGLSSLPIQAIEDAVQPKDDQLAALDRLDEASNKAVDALQAACPDTIPLTPVGRLEVMEKRLDAMVTAANTVKPALDDFYASLSPEQKARFNTLGEKQAKN